MPDGLLSLSQEQWISVLKLSHMWFFRRVRSLSIRKLQDLDPVQKLRLSMSCEVNEWLTPAIDQLVKRLEPLTLEEASSIGFEMSMKLMRIRDICYQNFRKQYPLTDNNSIMGIAKNEGLEVL